MVKTIYIDNVKIHGIISSLSEQLGIDYTNDGDDYCIDVDDAFGKGYIRGIQFSHGLSVIEAGLTSSKKIRPYLEKLVIKVQLQLFNYKADIN
ncbi:hypothetical protein [Psychroserpens burtonensis]|uniref:hypothetical protein n=1 Tax=Psychroserpens burtonensis TaxID=49278 RepID=UPI0003FED54B|nr:hypothetical protein [Psychroserpens burtonensis]